MKDCQQISELVERSKVERISLANRISIRFHNSLCKNCRNYFTDSALMDEMLSKRFRHLSDYSFTSEEKEEIKKKLTPNS